MWIKLFINEKRRIQEIAKEKKIKETVTADSSVQANELNLLF